jgi:hypothetical protein
MIVIKCNRILRKTTHCRVNSRYLELRQYRRNEELFSVDYLRYPVVFKRCQEELIESINGCGMVNVKLKWSPMNLVTYQNGRQNRGEDSV